ncbi:hypothetical protein Salat_1214100 [Sesamum alatum]|uniref:DDE Tnp4 domain-containing protein n=1 Tax=Sesamum alatum TaxID=300844 RepID=A0AAE2CP75_9LAMI|nr:hypothetical protein Salat_1214100 [Sesamum alatum]
MTDSNSDTRLDSLPHSSSSGNLTDENNDDENQVYTNYRETFNHRHSSLRSAIERSFGIWKEKWQMITDMPVNIPWPDQGALVPATMTIHNFIRKHDQYDLDFLNVDQNPNVHSEEDDVNGEDEDSHHTEVQQSTHEMDKLKDDICTSITFCRLEIPMN